MCKDRQVLTPYQWSIHFNRCHVPLEFDRSFPQPLPPIVPIDDQHQPHVANDSNDQQHRSAVPIGHDDQQPASPQPPQQDEPAAGASPVVPQVRGPRGRYNVAPPPVITLPTRKYKTPLFKIEAFRMTRNEHNESVKDPSDVNRIKRIIVPPSYCIHADATKPSDCRMLQDRSILRVVLAVPLPFIIELPAYRCTVHKAATATRASYTHWFSHALACKVSLITPHASLYPFVILIGIIGFSTRDCTIAPNHGTW